MKRKYFFLMFVLVLCSAGTFYACNPATGVAKPAEVMQPQRDSTIIYLLFAGDVMGHGPQIRAAYDEVTETYNYDSCWIWVKPFIDSADYAVANLEVTLAGEPYGGYPQFSSPDALASSLKNAGFDFLITANNHSVDRGKQGIERTLKILDSFNFPHTGTFRDSAERKQKYPALINVKGVRIVLLNYTYGTNGIPVPFPNIVNLIDTLQIARDLKAAKKMNPDLVVTTIHWGDEYHRKQNITQENLARWLAENGSDAIIGMHPHVVQPYEELNTSNGKKVPVFYSLGNFISNQRDRYKDGGIMAGLKIVKNDSGTYILTTDYIPFWVHKREEPVKYEIIPVRSYEKDTAVYQLDTVNDKRIKQFADDTRKLLENLQEK